MVGEKVIGCPGVGKSEADRIIQKLG